MDIKNIINSKSTNNPEGKRGIIKIIAIFFIIAIIALVLFYFLSSNNTLNDQPKIYKGEYTEYSSESLKNIKGRKTVLFFYNDESPASRVIDANIEDGGDKPDNLKIIKVDMYDYEDVKKKYKVQEDNIMIKIDENANEVKRSAELTNIKQIIEFVK